MLLEDLKMETSIIEVIKSVHDVITSNHVKECAKYRWTMTMPKLLKGTLK